MRRGAAPPAQRGWPHGVLAAAAGRQCRRCYAMQRQLLEIARYACRLRLPICSVSIRETVCPPAHDGDGSALAESAQRWMTSARPADTRAEHDELQGGCLGLGAELRALCEARRLCEAARQEAAAATAAAAGSQPAAAGRQVRRGCEEDAVSVQSLVRMAAHMHADRVSTNAQALCADTSGPGAASQPAQPALPPGFLPQLQCAPCRPGLTCRPGSLDALDAARRPATRSAYPVPAVTCQLIVQSEYLEVGERPDVLTTSTPCLQAVMMHGVPRMRAQGGAAPARPRAAAAGRGGGAAAARARAGGTRRARGSGSGAARAGPRAWGVRERALRAASPRSTCWGSTRDAPAGAQPRSCEVGCGALRRRGAWAGASRHQSALAVRGAPAGAAAAWRAAGRAACRPAAGCSAGGWQGAPGRAGALQPCRACPAARPAGRRQVGCAREEHRPRHGAAGAAAARQAGEPAGGRARGGGGCRAACRALGRNARPRELFGLSVCQGPAGAARGRAGGCRSGRMPARGYAWRPRPGHRPRCRAGQLGRAAHRSILGQRAGICEPIPRL